MNIDTICAIATAPGRGAIATIRLSGPDAFTIADAFFVSPHEGRSLASAHGGCALYGSFHDSGVDVDDVVALVFRAPHSFTGEDTVEFSCHGSRVIQSRILSALISGGARMARPGEFTKRAFSNGKMDLAQAEAVADVIASESEAARRVALSQLRGGYSEKLASLRNELVRFSSLLELELDFSEEDVEFADRSQLINLVDNVQSVVSGLALSFRAGNAIKNGIPTAIVGAPNVGKSTLLNALLGDDRAIVSDVEGTTRDSIEEVAVLGDMAFRFIDTAGIRNTSDKVEALGIERTRKHIAKAQLVLLLVDGSKGEDVAREALASVSSSMSADWQKLVLVANKSDVADCGWLTDDWAQAHGAEGAVVISAKRGDGLDALKGLVCRISAVDAGPEDVVVTNVRHFEALSLASGALARVADGLRLGLSGELVSQDLHEATNALASITGEVTSGEVLEEIFRHFCIGK